MVIYGIFFVSARQVITLISEAYLLFIVCKWKSVISRVCTLAV